MDKCLIVYFSQGGATAQVAEAMAEGWQEQNYSVDLHNLTDGPPPGLNGYAALGIGLPAYIFRPPFPVTDYLNSLPDLKGLPVFVFVICGSLPGDAGNIARHILAGKKGTDAGYFKSLGKDLYLGSLKKGYLFSPGHPSDEELTAAREFARQTVRRIQNKEFTPQAYDESITPIFRLERFFLHPWLVKHVLYRLFFLKRSKCTSCGLCAKVCPVKNISLNEKGLPVWGNKCILCFYCEMKCPTAAIFSPLSSPTCIPLIQYNIWYSLKDPDISFTRIKLEKGQIREIK